MKNKAVKQPCAEGLIGSASTPVSAVQVPAARQLHHLGLWGTQRWGCGHHVEITEIKGLTTLSDN